MAWIELHQTLPKNKKILRLKNILNIKTPQAVGHLCMIWLWALDNAQEGDLSSFTADEIAEVSEWSGRNPETFLKALIEAGFIDEDMHLHDWLEYAGKLVDQREIQREQARLRQQKRREKVAKQKDCHANVTRDNSVSHADVTHVPYPTVPNRTVPISVVVDSACAREGNGLSRVMVLYEEQLGTLPSPTAIELLKSYTEDMGADVVCRAIELAVDARAFNWRYIEKILQDWSRLKVKSLEDIQRFDAQRSSTKTPAAPGRKSFADLAEEMERKK